MLVYLQLGCSQKLGYSPQTHSSGKNQGGASCLTWGAGEKTQVQALQDLQPHAPPCPSPSLRVRWQPGASVPTRFPQTPLNPQACDDGMKTWAASQMVSRL